VSETLAIVTASTNLTRAAPCLASWRDHAATAVQILVVENGTILGPPYLGTVPAFRTGVSEMLEQSDADVIACLHDDVEILERDWDLKVLRHFTRHPGCGLLGFGGAIGLGDADLYQTPYNPMQLARIGFRSDLVDAEAHGARSLLPERVACLDGFSQIGRREFWEGHLTPAPFTQIAQAASENLRPWAVLEDLGLKHHIYDGALGCLAKRYGWETWYLPVRCRHLGGQTAVGDPGYQAWAKTQHAGGDHGFWEDGHRIVYDAFRDVLPLRV
jgi:hypothetical protein